jgi:hypothetical protein
MIASGTLENTYRNPFSTLGFNPIFFEENWNEVRQGHFTSSSTNLRAF